MATVSNADVAEIQRLGMKAALEKYQRGEGSEGFNEAIRRFYPNMQDNKNVAPTFNEAAKNTRQPYSRGETAANTSRPSARSGNASTGIGNSRPAARPVNDTRTPSSRGGRSSTTRDVGTPSRAALARRVSANQGAEERKNPRNFGEWIGGLRGRLDERKRGNSAVGPSGSRRSGPSNIVEATRRANNSGARNVGEFVSGAPQRKVVKKKPTRKPVRTLRSSQM